jgi:hypothetical protein
VWLTRTDPRRRSTSSGEYGRLMSSKRPGGAATMSLKVGF